MGGLTFHMFVLYVMLANMCQAVKLVKTNVSDQTNYIGQADTARFDQTDHVIARFLGIPFAKPPIGERRFQKPEPAVVTDTMYDARKFKSICVQMSKPSNPCVSRQTMSEDCLYVNVYVPLSKLASNDVSGDIAAINGSLTPTLTGTALLLPAEKKAVFVYIFGGAWIEGNGNCYDGSILAGLGDVIVVTFNYRVGLLGFAATEDDVIPGNAGLWDQILALQWVKDNIRVFGGDAGCVTIGGTSAGSISSLTFGLLPEYGQLFQRMIPMSGSVCPMKYISTSGYGTTLSGAQKLGCDPRSSKQDVKSCLMNQTAQSLAYAIPEIQVPFGLPVATIVEAPLIPTHPCELITGDIGNDQTKQQALNKFGQKDLLIGIVSEDGESSYQIWSFTNHLNKTANPYISIELLTQMIFDFFASKYGEKINDYKYIIDTAIDRYLDWATVNNDTERSNQVVTLLTDLFFKLPAVDVIRAHEQRNTNVTSRGRRYLYRFKWPRTSALYKQYIYPWFEGSEHDSDIVYVFGDVTDPVDVAISKVIMTYWTNFIKTG